MRKAILFLLFLFQWVVGFTQGAIKVRRPVIEAPPLPTGRANVWFIIVPVTLAIALVVYICLRVRKRILERKYSGSSSKRRRHKKRSSSASSSGSSGASAAESSSGIPRSSRSSGSSSGSSSSGSRSRSSSSRSGKSSSGSSSSGRRGSRWTAALENQASSLLPGQPDVFYMPPPDAGGKFSASTQKFHTNDRPYQFVVLPDTPNEAVLRFAGNETELRAAHEANLPEWHMMCKVSGFPGAEGAGFTQQPGQAMKEEGIWVMKEKVHIHFNG